MIAYSLLSMIFLWAFLGTIDGPAVNLGIAAGSIVCKTPQVLDSERAVQARPLSIGVFPQEPPPVHPSFLLFDFLAI